MTPPLWEDVKSICSALWRAAIQRMRPQRIESGDGLVEFIHSRAVYVGQTALYGYLRTRVGTQYRELFQDDRFARAIRISRGAVIRACLEDLTIHAVLHLVRAGALDPAQAPEVATALLGRAQAALAAQDLAPAEGWEHRLARRLNGFDWTAPGSGDAAFATSPEALVEHAPVIDAYKELDREIVMNSVRFRWADIRDQLSRRIDAPAVARDIAKALT